MCERGATEMFQDSRELRSRSKRKKEQNKTLPVEFLVHGCIEVECFISDWSHFIIFVRNLPSMHELYFWKMVATYWLLCQFPEKDVMKCFMMVRKKLKINVFICKEWNTNMCPFKRKGGYSTRKVGTFCLLIVMALKNNNIGETCFKQKINPQSWNKAYRLLIESG